MSLLFNIFGMTNDDWYISSENKAEEDISRFVGFRAVQNPKVLSSILNFPIVGRDLLSILENKKLKSLKGGEIFSFTEVYLTI